MEMSVPNLNANTSMFDRIKHWSCYVVTFIVECIEDDPPLVFPNARILEKVEKKNLQQWLGGLSNR